MQLDLARDQACKLPSKLNISCSLPGKCSLQALRYLMTDSPSVRRAQSLPKDHFQRCMSAGNATMTSSQTYAMVRQEMVAVCNAVTEAAELC